MKRLASLLVSMTVAAAAAAQHIPEECLRACDSLGEGCRQALVVLADKGCDCDIFFMRRDGQWRCMSQVRGTTGRSGVIDARLKREGDGATPAGVYPLRRGLWREADVGTLFPMEIYDERYLWVDDPESEMYNTLLRDAGDQWSGRGERAVPLYRGGGV